MSVPVVALGIKDVTDPALEGLTGKVQYFPLGQLSKPIAALKAAGVRRAVMVGNRGAGPAIVKDRPTPCPA